MRAIVLEKFGGLDSLVYKDIPEPEPKAGHVVIEIKAFGINHAEMHMRRGEWAEAAPVSGIECVGLVKSCPGGEFPVGAKVAALMGGLGRTINGSYAEYTRAPVSNVALIEPICRGPSSRQSPRPTRPPGPACSAISRSTKGQTARHPRRDLVLRPGCAQDGGQCRRPGHRDHPQPRALRHAGEARRRTLRDRTARSLEADRRGEDRSTRCSTSSATASCSIRSRCFAAAAASCLAGWLGGLDPIPDFNPLLQMASGVYLTFFGSFVFGTPGFPLSDVPLQTDRRRTPRPAGSTSSRSRVFRFDEIREAHRVMEANEAHGKMVVVHD